MSYFSECKTVEEAKKKFRELAFIHHPDKGGKTEDMQNVLSEYNSFLSSHDYDMNNFKSDHDFFSSADFDAFFKKIFKDNPRGAEMAKAMAQALVVAMVGAYHYQKNKSNYRQNKTKFNPQFNKK